MPKIVCEAKNIKKSFGSYLALDDVSIKLRDSEIFGLLGSNGAGKSTLTNIMSGLIEQDEGEVSYYGYDLRENYNEIKQYFSIVPQEISCYYGFTIRENLKFFGLMYGVKGQELKEKIDYLLDWLNLTKYAKKPVNTLSGGYKRLTNIACSLLHDPDIIFMDEPTAGLDPKIRHMMWEKIEQLKDDGKSICLTTHYLDEAEELCDTVGMLFNGKLLVSGTPENLISKYGGYRVVTLKMDRIVPQEISDTIKRVLKESLVDVTGNKIIISFEKKDSLEKISTLTKWLSDKGYKVKNSVVKEPELEDVFLNITGQQLRD